MIIKGDQLYQFVIENFPFVARKTYCENWYDTDEEVSAALTKEFGPFMGFRPVGELSGYGYEPVRGNETWTYLRGWAPEDKDENRNPDTLFFFKEEMHAVHAKLLIYA